MAELISTVAIFVVIVFSTHKLLYFPLKQSGWDDVDARSIALIIGTLAGTLICGGYFTWLS